MRTFTLLPFLLAISQLTIAQNDWNRPNSQPKGSTLNSVYSPTTKPDSSLKSGSPKAIAPRLVTASGGIYPVQSNQLASIHGLPTRSFYQSKTGWRHIIDSTWGPGEPLATKLAIFDSYADSLSKKFDGFLSLGLNWNSWDSLKNEFRSRIDSATSRGVFASIMAQFAMSMRDGHTWAWDRGVTLTALSPGVPVLVLYPFAQADHFGAVLTMLPDSTALVLRTVPNHPLGLKPGDIVLGYEGVPWKQLVRELLDAQLPVFSNGMGAASAEIHSFIRNAGNNWHLFSTIDILKYATHDTLHLSVGPLLDLPVNPMMGNEQMEIPGIPFSFYRGWPWTPTGQLLASGKLPSANVGYIRLQGEFPNEADAPFASAVDSLWNAEGLIIDLRWNTGGWASFDQAFAKMFSQKIYPLNEAYRAGQTNLSLTPAAEKNYFVIPGVQGSIYDRPIAVLLGPTCVSLGEITAQRLRYHPMARFFGKPSIASLGWSEDVTGYPDWWLHYSIGDMYHLSQPGVYLNRSEFPIDEPIWFNADDVAQGIDPVLARALQWISNLSYAHGAVLSEDTVWHASDSIRITAKIENPGNHELLVSAIITKRNGSKVDSLILSPFSGDSLRAAYIKAPAADGKYIISVRTDDLTSGSYRRLPNVKWFTSLSTYIDLHKEYPGITIYPNPTDGLINIEFEKPGNTKIEIFTSIGEMIYSKEVKSDFEKIDMSGFSKGVYFVKVKQQGILKVGKVVVK